ncbi:MAG: anti-sigma factor [Alphaproteobacteria bacterium]|nr:MAG: anti-sigma factor [Alphaproteobacteria bacterium]
MVDREPTVSEEELHAYVDGQIAGGECAVVEKWLESHPEDAARVAAWRAQAEAIRARYGAVASEPVPPRFDLDRLTRANRKWPRLAAAAALLAFLVGGTAGWLGRGAWEGAMPARAVTTEALDAHRLYIAEVRHPIEVKAGESHLNPWLARRIGYPLPTPDLDTLGLKLLGGRLLPGTSGRAAALYMYEGSTGERFTVYCRRDQAPQTALRYRATGPVGSFFWVDDDVAFVVSGPADRARLQKVAETVYEQVESHQRTSSTLRHLSDVRAVRR